MSKKAGCAHKECPLVGRVELLEHEFACVRAEIRAMDSRSSQAQAILLELQGNVRRVLKKLDEDPDESPEGI